MPPPPTNSLGNLFGGGLFAISRDLELARRYGIMWFAIACFDTLALLPLERQYIWPAKWTLAKALFLINRWFVLGLQVLMQILDAVPIPRAINMPQFVAEALKLEGCGTLGHAQLKMAQYLTIWGTFFFIDAAVLALTLYRSIKITRQIGKVPIIRALWRHGALYYLITTIVHLVSVTLILQQVHPRLKALNAPASLVLTQIVEYFTGWIRGKDYRGRAVTNPQRYFFDLRDLVDKLKKDFYPQEFRAWKSSITKKDFLSVPGLFQVLRDMSYKFYRALSTIPVHNLPASDGLLHFCNAVEEIRKAKRDDYRKVFAETARIAVLCAQLPEFSKQYFVLVERLSQIDACNAIPSVCWTVKMSLVSLAPLEVSRFGSSQTFQIVPIENPLVNGPKFRQENVTCLQKLELDLSDLAALSKGTTRSQEEIIEACDPIDITAETALGTEKWHHHWDYWGRIFKVPQSELHLDPSEDLVGDPASPFEVIGRRQ
ncbi:hypothetical protein JCM5350_002630 [Sporobolomyces pararoseus]